MPALEGDEASLAVAIALDFCGGKGLVCCVAGL